MIKNLLLFICIFLFSNSLYARKVGETEILTDEGIEVYQEEKYYILKKNVIITSDDFILLGDFVKVDFEKDLYDVTNIFSEGNSSLKSEVNNIKATGPNINIIVKNEQIEVIGKKSEFKLGEIFMKSNGKIMVNNLTGKFSIIGENSNMITESIYIEGQKIDGFFSTNSEEKEIIKLNVYDDNISFVQNEDTDMYAKKIIYDKKTSIIEMFDDVKVVRGKEIVTGDYGTLDTSDNSYKVKSNNTKKVKVIISNENE